MFPQISSIVCALFLAVLATWSAGSQTATDATFAMHIGRSFTEADGLPATMPLAIDVGQDGRFVAQFPEGVFVMGEQGWAKRPDGPVPSLMVRSTVNIPAEVLESIPVLPVTVAARDPFSGIWVGTPQGAAFYFAGEWSYRQGRRWLPHDRVLDVRVDLVGNALFLTPGGLGYIERRLTSFAAKAAHYEAEIDKRHRRTEYEYVLEASLSRAGDLSEWRNHDSDNDGLWTGMYGAAQCFAYAATKSEVARQRAKKAMRALAFLSEVTQGGSHPAPPGFPARAILPTSGPDPNISDSMEHDRKRRAEGDKLWKVFAPRWPTSADGKWYWKTDTSSDELDGHYFLYGLYYDLVAETEQEREEVRKVVRRVTDHLLAHDYALVDHDGEKTRWAIFGPKELNGSNSWWMERGLNSLSILTYLRVASHVTEDPRYDAAADELIEKHGYLHNLMYPKFTLGVGGGNQSDDEMAFMNYYHLLKYEKDPERKALVAMSLAGYWELEKPEANPFFDFVAASQLDGLVFLSAHDEFPLSPQLGWRRLAVDTLRRFPMNLVDWPMRNSHRRDLQPLPGYVRPDVAAGSLFLRKDGRVIPVDERVVFHWNLDPYRVDSAGSGMRVADGTSYLLPYYMGLYHGFLNREQ